MNIAFNIRKATLKSFFEKHNTNVRFFLAGVLNTTIGLLTYPLLYISLESYDLHYLTILVITYIITITISFLSNKLFVFKTEGRYLIEFSKFFTFHFVHFLINLAILPIMVEYANMNPIYAQPIFAIIVIVSSYFWHKNITFSHKS